MASDGQAQLLLTHAEFFCLLSLRELRQYGCNSLQLRASGTRITVMGYTSETSESSVSDSEEVSLSVCRRALSEGDSKVRKALLNL